MFRFLLFSILAILASCGSPLDDRVEDLVAAKNVWLAVSKQRTYSYTLRIQDSGPYTVSVSIPELLREDLKATRTCSAKGGCRFEPTIRELFQLVLDLNGEKQREGIRLEVAYDETLGYPRMILWDDYSGSHSAVLIRVSDIVFDE